MKESLLKLFKIVLMLSVIILIILFAFGITLILDWPLWMGFVLLVAFVGIGIGVVYLRKLLQKRREQVFVQQVIDQDDESLKRAKESEKKEMKDIQRRWKEAVDSLKRSHLKKFGNPLYVLPWYMVMGESGSGKTTAINSARLSSPFVEVTKTHGISGTKNCDWWFFEKAVILDTAGRYAIPVDEGRDKDEWQKFMKLLVKYRRKQPLHGLVIAVAADKILESSPSVLEEDGKQIRRRIDELMNVIGIKFPVYIMVTKCDLIQGMNHFCDNLSDKATGQPMGVINEDLNNDTLSFLNRAMTTVGERLRNLRNILLHKIEPGKFDPALLLFPEEFGNLKPGLEAFMKAAFQENPYLETPVLRGLFFSSGRQEGSPFSHFLNNLGLISEKEVLPGTDRGLFLHEFFSNILPSDRGLFAPTSKAVQWQAVTRNLGIVSWILIGIALCGLLSFSFVKNLRALRGASHEFTNPPVMTGEFIPDLVTLDNFNNAINKVEQQNKDWWIPRFGLNESIDAERELKNKYVRQFGHDFLPPLDDRLFQLINNISHETPDDAAGVYIAYVVRRLNLMGDRIRGEENEIIKSMPAPYHGLMLSNVDQESGSGTEKTFGRLYLNYLIWQDDTAAINNSMIKLQAILKRLLSVKGSNPKWIVSWINNNSGVAPLKLGDFWVGEPPADDSTVIAPAFTRPGKDTIDGFIKEIEQALPDPLIFANQKKEFDKWYRKEAFDSWHAFTSDFLKGKERLKTREEWKQTALIVADDSGPFFSLLNRITSDLEPVVENSALPPWYVHVYDFLIIKQKGETGSETLSKAALKLKQVMGRLADKLGRSPGSSDSMKSKLTSEEAYLEYIKSLKAITALTDSRDKIDEMVEQTYKEDYATGKSPYLIAYKAIEKMKASMTGNDRSDEVWKIISGPFDFLWDFALRNTSCRLQNLWEQDVLSEIEGATGREAIKIVLNPEGSARKFIKSGPASVFYSWNKNKGFYAVNKLGNQIPFYNDFMIFLKNSSNVQSEVLTRKNYSVEISALPTEVNRGARVKPDTTKLRLQCSDKKDQEIINSNFPVTRTFNWSPENCGDVTFEIMVGNITLKERLQGPEAFLDFLEKFDNGKRLFFRAEFPDQEDSLKLMGVKYIEVKYRFSGARELIEKFRTLPDQIPKDISFCWSN